MASRWCAKLAACAVSMTVYATFLQVSLKPCTYSISRVLLGVVDPCAASDAMTSTHKKLGGPIVTNQATCGDAELPAHALPPLPLHCCPPKWASEAVDFTLPDPAEPLRVRRPAHAADMSGYERAMALMKALPHTDPRSFYQQANLHCAYCSGAHRQTGYPELTVQIHSSWLFFPFHRAYIYFFERIAAKLLGEPGFALPFWSWDVPEGIRMPPEFANSSSPLCDTERNRMHAPPKVVDLDYAYVDKNLTDEQQIQHNLRVMYKQMISNAPLPSLFHGQPLRAGQAANPGAGTVEDYPHATMHAWTGDTINNVNGENMGNFYSAGRDPLFYAHHNNIDRLWEAWREVGHRGHVDFADPDWLDSSFLFHDEESRLVRITVRDVLDTDKLRYTFHGVSMPWLDARPPITPNVNTKKASLKSVRFPVSLDAAVTAELWRPLVLRSRQEKEVQEEEVLVVEGIEAHGTGTVKFDVYINAMEYENVEPLGREMAGSYVSLNNPSMDGRQGIQASMRVALNELLEDLGADGDESVTVTLVPRHGKVIIGRLRIVYMVE